jgi:hypothetical protein
MKVLDCKPYHDPEFKKYLEKNKKELQFEFDNRSTGIDMPFLYFARKQYVKQMLRGWEDEA